MDSLVALATKFPHLLPADSDASINTEFDNGVELKVGQIKNPFQYVSI